jgi:hypothetical protein
VKFGPSADALGVGAAKLLVSLAVLAGGFRCVSDDDYARVVIAQRFAETPHLDPSGTSWLPLPFWIYGAAFRLLGGSLGVARCVAIFLGVGAALLLLVAARLLGAGRPGALLGALLAALFPWSVWLGAATVPELPAAALVVFGMATLAEDAPRTRSLGAVAIGAACFSRYEAWPIAVAFAACVLADAARSRDARSAVPAMLALGPILLWLCHGVFVHGDALFFWRRVASYRRALGPGPALSDRLWAVPRSLFVEEPELWLGLAFMLAPLRALTRYRRPVVASLALVVFLALGELSGSGPTHHASRAVLPVWLLAALALGDVVGRAFSASRAHRRAWLAYPGVVLAFGWLYRGLFGPDFPDRSAAVDIGDRARELGASALLIDSVDYSYLAVTAAFGKPNDAFPFDDQDPRHPRSRDAFASPDSLRAEWARHPEAWLVVSSASPSFSARHLTVARATGSLRAQNQVFALFAPMRAP